jgi:hypothetical protein
MAQETRWDCKRLKIFCTGKKTIRVKREPTEEEKNLSWALVAHDCNPSYSGGRDQEDCSSKPAWTNNSTRPYLKKPFTKIGLVGRLKVRAMSSSPSTTQKKSFTAIFPAED